MIVAAIVVLRLRGGGWPMSPYPPQRLVTTGVYALVAHPLYLGSILLTLGLSMRFANAAGIWIVTPVLAASCMAFVWGNEEERTRELFGARTTHPLIHLPAPSDARPVFSDRLSACLLALLPWFIVYEAINLFDTPADALGVTSARDARIPVIGWTELVYFLTYPLVLFAPLVARTKRDLRDLTIRAWIATAGSAMFYLALPTVFEKKPVPGTPFAPLLEWERAFDAPNTALPAFHVIWSMLVISLYARAFPRMRAMQWPIVLAIAASCVTTGMHAIADVLAGLALGLVFVHIEAVWRWLALGAEIVSESLAEWRGGPVRLINHGLYAAFGVAIGVALNIVLAGAAYRNAILFIAASIIAGAAIWAQSVEGSAALLRPFGYYGGILGGAIAIAIASLWGLSGLLLLASYAVAAPFIQAAGRFRCLVQGCCHGRPTANAIVAALSTGCSAQGASVCAEKKNPDDRSGVFVSRNEVIHPHPVAGGRPRPPCAAAHCPVETREQLISIRSCDPISQGSRLHPGHDGVFCLGGMGGWEDLTSHSHPERPHRASRGD